MGLIERGLGKSATAPRQLKISTRMGPGFPFFQCQRGCSTVTQGIESDQYAPTIRGSCMSSLSRACEDGHAAMSGAGREGHADGRPQLSHGQDGGRDRPEAVPGNEARGRHRHKRVGFCRLPPLPHQLHKRPDAHVHLHVTQKLLLHCRDTSFSSRRHRTPPKQTSKYLRHKGLATAIQNSTLHATRILRVEIL
jgi:hypothetical protein